MRLYLEVNTRKFLVAQGQTAVLNTINFKRRDFDELKIRFLDGKTPVALPENATGQIGFKKQGVFNSPFLAFASSWVLVTTNNVVEYVFDVNLNTELLNQEFATANDVLCMLEISWQYGNNIISSQTIQAKIFNDVIVGGEGAPETMPDMKATLEDALAGTDNSKWMTPLRVKQAIDEFSSSSHNHDDLYYRKPTALALSIALG